jgi:hypothetical protein
VPLALCSIEQLHAEHEDVVGAKATTSRREALLIAIGDALSRRNVRCAGSTSLCFSPPETRLRDLQDATSAELSEGRVSEPFGIQHLCSAEIATDELVYAIVWLRRRDSNPGQLTREAQTSRVPAMTTQGWLGRES